MESSSAPEAVWRVDPSRCDGCGDCVVICPVGALKVIKKVANLVDEASCCHESCRICERHCSRDAIRFY